MALKQKPETTAKIVADSLGPNGVRLITYELTYPLIIHAELMTYRELSRNTASNRAIPVERMIEAVTTGPFVPKRWPVNKSGMQNEEWLDDAHADMAEEWWRQAAAWAVKSAQHLLNELHVHKQITNRLLGPFLHTTAIVSSTQWANLFTQRCHHAAQPEMRELAYAMQYEYFTHEPDILEGGEWHLPYITERERNEYDTPERAKVTSPMMLQYASVARCAAISFLNHGEDKWHVLEAFHKGLKRANDGHWSPFEHVAQARNDLNRIGNFRGFTQFRKFFENENAGVFHCNHPALCDADGQVIVPGLYNGGVCVDP